MNRGQVFTVDDALWLYVGHGTVVAADNRPLHALRGYLYLQFDTVPNFKVWSMFAFTDPVVSVTGDQLLFTATALADGHKAVGRVQLPGVVNGTLVVVNDLAILEATTLPPHLLTSVGGCRDLGVHVDLTGLRTLQVAGYRETVDDTQVPAVRDLLGSTFGGDTWHFWSAMPGDIADAEHPVFLDDDD